MNATSLENLVRDNLTDEHVGEYLTAPSDWKIAIYPDGTISVGPSVGDEIAEDERPLATAKCPGIGDLVSTDFTADFCSWDEEKGAYIVDGRYCNDKGRVVGDLADVVRETCRDGDVSSYHDNLVAKLTETV